MAHEIHPNLSYGFKFLALEKEVAGRAEGGQR